MRDILLYICIVIVAALMFLGCGDPTKDISEARVNEAQPADTETAPTEPAATAPAAEAPAPEPVAESPAKPAPGPVAMANPPSGPAGLAVKIYSLTDDSTIGFEGYKVTGSHVGGFAKFDGRVVVPPDGIEAAIITVKIDMTSTYSDDPGLTDKLKGPDFFDVDNFPEATFQSTAIERSDDGYTVTGNLTLDGITQNISFPAQITQDRQGLKAEAEFTINRNDFGIEYAGIADDLIKDKVVIRLDVEGRT